MVPTRWLLEHACPSIRLRTLRELSPDGAPVDEELLASAEGDAVESREVQGILKKQKDTGIWSSNILGIGADSELGIRAAGTVTNYRRLTELGVPGDHRALRLTNRVFFRVLSRDPDPKLLFEYGKISKDNLPAQKWARAKLQSGVTAALVGAGMTEDPRVRGAANRVVDDCAKFVSGPLADDPFIKNGSRTVLHPDAHPPSLFAVAIAANLPLLQRQRAGFVDKLAAYLQQPPPKGSWSIKLGSAYVTPKFHFLGDPLAADASGKPKDIPFAIHWIETLARLGALEASDSGRAALAWFLKDCDDQGVWSPRNLKDRPKSRSGLADFAFPLESQNKRPEHLRTDVTFRLALIAKLSRFDLEFE